MAPERKTRGPYKRYSAEFKREQVERVLRGEVTAAELSRELGVARSQIQRWKHLLTRGGETAVASDEDVVPTSELRAAQARIRELERVLGRKQMMIEIFEAAQDEIKKKRTGTACRSADGAPRERDLRGAEDRPREGVPSPHRARRPLCESGGSCRRGADPHSGPRAGELRVSAHHGGDDTRYDRKRIRRVMAIEQWTLPRPMKRRSTRPHRGLVQRPFANERWSSDAIEIACWNGEVVEIAFALDCCDRECLAWVASSRKLSGEDIRTLVAAAVRHRFGDARPAQPIQWLSDNGTIYTALETMIAVEQLGLAPITTPVRSPESNGISEAFHHTLRRDYVDGADLSSAAVLLEQLPQWIADYNHFAPHSALGMRSPIEYRSLQEIASD